MVPLDEAVGEGGGNYHRLVFAPSLGSVYLDVDTDLGYQIRHCVHRINEYETKDGRCIFLPG